MKQANNKISRSLTALLALILLLTPTTIVSAEKELERATASTPRVSVTREQDASLDGALLISGTTYVPFRAFLDTYGLENGIVGWQSNTKTATYTAPSLSIEAAIHQPYLIANERIFYRDAPNLLIEDKTYVPIRALAAALSLSVTWYADEQSRSVTLTGSSRAVQDAATYYKEEDLLWLSRVIRAEAEGEPLAGKIAVGNVVMNRIESKDFPNSVYEVIFDCPNGAVQFYRPGDKHILREPTEESILAAKIVLEGYSLSTEALFYLNPRTAKNFWIVKNRRYLFTIGQHDFYA